MPAATVAWAVRLVTTLAPLGAIRHQGGPHRRHAMDAVKLLKDDHKKVKDLFRQFEKARSADRKKKIAEEAMNELTVHAEIEEEIFYPAAKAKADKEGKALVAEAVEEHHVVKVLIGELKA